MKNRLRHWLVVGLAAATAAGCSKIDPITAPAPSGGNANFGVYASMGTSVTAGWQSGGLVDRHQTHSYAVLFARQAGATSFTVPSVSADGMPALLRIVSLSPLVISNAGRTAGTPTNAAQVTAYHNMAIPYSILFDVADSSLYYSGIAPRPTEPFVIIARHRGTILQEVVSLGPTFVSMEYGNNEVLAPATNGSGTVSPTPAQFAGLLTLTLNALQAQLPQAKLALLNVPFVTSIPYFTTFSPITVDAATLSIPTPLIGPGGTPLGPGDRVLLNAGPSLAAGNGFPVGAYNYVNPPAGGNGNPLLDSQVLSTAEGASIRTTVDGYNAAIAAEASARGAALVDLHGLLQEATTGLRYQGTTYNTKFITGGLFSLDGVHPTDLAHGFLCNTMIAAVNATYGAGIPPADLSQAASLTASRLRPTYGEGKLYPVIENAEEFYRQMFPQWRAPLP